MLNDAPFNRVTGEIIGAAIEVHRAVGPGLLESIYLACMEVELVSRGLRYERERPVPLVYKERPLDVRFRVDLIVERSVVVEVKSIATVLPVHHAQLLSYVKLTGCQAGLLINFNVPKLVDGVKRIVGPGAAAT